MGRQTHLAFVTLLAAWGCLSVGCEKRPSAAAPSPPPPAPVENEPPPLQPPSGQFVEGFRLIDPGQHPRSALRYVPVIGAKQMITSRHDHGTAVWEDGRRVGIEQTPNSVAVVSIEPLALVEGGVHIRCEQQGIWVTEEDETGWEGWIADFARLSWTAMEQSVAADYFPSGRVFSDPTENDAEGAHGQSVLHLSMLSPVLLPEEPVGIGAVWEMNQTAEIATVSTLVQRRYRLRAVEGSRIVVEMSQRHVGTPGPTPTSTHDSAELVSREVIVQGEAVMDLTLPGPVSGWFESDYTTRARAYKGTQATEVVSRSSFLHSWEPYEAEGE